jgi:hypothetical protein
MSDNEFDDADWGEALLVERRSHPGAKRVLVTGGRDYKETHKVYTFLSDLHYRIGVCCVIQGGADGADYAAKLWAHRFGVPVEEYKADWSRYGKKAGPVRNQTMLEVAKPDICLAFPGGKGTADMTRRAAGAGIEIIRVA